MSPKPMLASAENEPVIRVKMKIKVQLERPIERATDDHRCSLGMKNAIATAINMNGVSRIRRMSALIDHCIQYLIENGADLELADSNGVTPEEAIDGNPALSAKLNAMLKWRPSGK
jgi:hypothetical protein